MKLTHKQKKYLKNNIYQKSLDVIASDLSLPKNVIKAYLQKQWSKERYQTLLDQEQKGNNSTRLENINFKKWFIDNRWQILILTVLVIITYINSINNQFVSDDINGIVKNSTLNNIKVIFNNPFASFHFFIYYTVNQLFGHSAAAFRLVSILFHLANVIGLYFLISFLFTSRIGFFTALLFAVHPLLSEAVVWISAGYTVYATFWILTSFIFFLFSLAKNKTYQYFLAVFFYFLALESSEKVVIFPLILFFYLLSQRNLRKYWLKLIPFFTLSLVWGGYLLKAMTKRTIALRKMFYQRATVIQNPWQFLSITFKQTVVAVSSYFKLIIWPQNLTLYHSELHFNEFVYLIMVGVFLFYLGVIIYFYFHNKKLFFWLLFFLITLSPTLTPYKVSWVVAERYVYMASIGIFVVLGVVIDELARNEKYQDILWICLTVIVMGLSIRTIARNHDWKNQDTLWLAAAKTSPSSPQNHNNLGDYYSRHGQLVKAAEEFKKAIILKSNYADAYHNLANTYHRMGKDNLAVENYQKALHFNHRLWQSYENLAAIYFSQKKFGLAEKNLKEAVKINPKNANILVNLGIVYLKLDKRQEAKRMFSQALKIDPTNRRARRALSLN